MLVVRHKSSEFICTYEVDINCYPYFKAKEAESQNGEGSHCEPAMEPRFKPWVSDSDGQAANY